MKTKTILALLLFAPIIASAQVQTFFSTARFATNVFLHDNTNTPVHLRIPTNAVIDAVTSTDGSVTVTTNAGVVNLQVANIDASGWSGFAATQNVDVGLFSLENVFAIRGPPNAFDVAATNLLLAPNYGGNEISRGNVQLARDAYLVGEGDTVISSTLTNNVIIKGFDAYTGGQSGGSVTIRAGVGQDGVQRNVVITNGQYYGNAANLTNFPASLLTVSSGNTNYYRITTPPANNAAAGEFGQIAYNSTNIFLYHAASGKWLRVTGTLEW
jgi:hypothetical protein